MTRMIGIGSYFGIPVRLHWSFAFVLIFISAIALLDGLDVIETLVFTLYIFCLFLCVTLHEYGHALMARKFGIVTHDIILSPIGGIARMERLPHRPSRELLVSIAGPLVNLAIALLLITSLYLFANGIDFPETDDLSILMSPVGFFHLLLILNLVLFLFNLIPAFPMDGGRILRALLALKCSRLTATYWAMIVGRIIATVFIILGVWQVIPSLALIGVFIFYMSAKEYQFLKNNGLQA